jgi:hypothetical protein
MWLSIVLLATWAAEGPCVSGPSVGQRPGPYAFVMSTGSERGKSHCYICETADRPMVILFARKLSEPLGKLTEKLDKAVVRHKKDELRSWVTLLADDQNVLDRSIVDWSRKRGLKAIPIGVFEDTVGPPTYKLHADAEITVLLAVKQKVVANFAYREGELTDAQIADILASLPKILPSK